MENTSDSEESEDDKKDIQGITRDLLHKAQHNY